MAKRKRTRRIDLVKDNSHGLEFRARLLIGGKGQGKSTWLRDRIDDYVVDRDYDKLFNCTPRVLIHDMSGSRAFRDFKTTEQFALDHGLKLKDPIAILAAKKTNGQPLFDRGVLRHVCRKEADIERMNGFIADHFRKGVVVFDEWTTYVKPHPPTWQVDLLNNHRNYELDIYYVCHQLMLVPLVWSRGDMIADIILFKTGENNLSQKQIERYACSGKLWPAYNRVKKAPKRKTYGQYHEIIKTLVE
jgi:hypothetical protein